MKIFCSITLGFSFGLLSVAPFLAAVLFAVSAAGIVYASREDLR